MTRTPFRRAVPTALLVIAAACTGAGAPPEPSADGATTPASGVTTDDTRDDDTRDDDTVDDDTRADTGAHDGGGIGADTIGVESLAFPGRLWEPFLPAPETGSPVTVTAHLTLPDAPSPPVAIIVPGCGGSVASSYREWARELAGDGVATVLLDSLEARGVREVCSGRETVNVADLIVDVYRTVDVLRDDARVDGDRVAVIGFSFGGRTALWSALTRFQDAYGGRPLAGYVAFYPSTCYIRLADEAVAGGPIRILHGTADDYTPISPCREYVDRLVAAGADAEVIGYEGAPHGFDDRAQAFAVIQRSPSIPSPRNCAFLEVDGAIVDPDTGDVAGVGSPCVELGVSHGYDREARAAAARDLDAFLTEIFER